MGRVYGCQGLPVKTLHPGPALEVADGVYNVKNPACYLYPDENGCAPGDHFTASQGAEAAAFVEFRSFRFEVPARQTAANVWNGIALAAVAIYALAWPASRLVRRRGG